MRCPWCGVDGYDNVIFLAADPKRVPRCADCLNDVRSETIDRLDGYQDERAWWVKRYAAAHVSGEAGFEASRQMTKRANEWAAANPVRMTEPY